MNFLVYTILLFNYNLIRFASLNDCVVIEFDFRNILSIQVPSTLSFADLVTPKKCVILQMCNPKEVNTCTRAGILTD